MKSIAIEFSLNFAESIQIILFPHTKRVLQDTRTVMIICDIWYYVFKLVDKCLTDDLQFDVQTTIQSYYVPNKTSDSWLPVDCQLTHCIFRRECFSHILWRTFFLTVHRMLFTISLIHTSIRLFRCALMTIQVY